ncbi:MAG TPA: hypothetical protein VGD58_14605 [Herpetosiphonaceae bacterium]
MAQFGLGLLAGGLLTLILLSVLLRLLGRTPEPVTPARSSELPDLTLSLTRELLQRLIDDSLRDVSLPLISLRDPSVQLEPDAILVVRMRGDTVLLGAQMIVLRMRVVPAATGVQVVTQAADVGGLLDLAGPLTERLDQQINAELAQRLAFAEQFEVLSVDGTVDEVTITARMKQ